MNFLKIKLLVIAVVMFAASSAFASISYNVNVNTSSLLGQTGYIDIQMNPFDTTASNVATATTSNFAADAAFAFIGAPVYTGNAFGLLSDNTLSASTAGQSGFNDYFQQVTFGNTLHFQLNLAGDPGNMFALAFYAADGSTPLFSTDSNYGAAARIDLTANGAVPYVTSNETAVTPTPIPGAVYLLGSGLMGLVGLRRKKQD